MKNLPIVESACGGGTRHVELRSIRSMQKRSIIQKILILCVSLGLMFLGLEIGLRLGKNVLPMNISNMLLSKYNHRAEWIYFKDDQWYINILKPDFRQTMNYNGYQWQHRTNQLGIRANLDFTQAEIVVLGDSFIYGHGVNLEETLAYQLETMLGKKVANLGVQGDYPPFELIRLIQLGLFLKPAIVLFFINGQQDLSDFLIYRPSPKYIKNIVAEKPPDYSRFSNHVAYLKGYADYKKYFPHRFSSQLYTVRLGYGLSKVFRGISKTKSKNVDKETAQRRIKYIRQTMRAIMATANDLCQQNGARLIIVFQATEDTDEEKWNQFGQIHLGTDLNFNQLCEKIGQQLQIPYLKLANKSPKATYYLKGDYHYSPKGNKWAARSIQEYLIKGGYLQ